MAAKEQIFICNSVIDEEIARRVLNDRDRVLAGIRERVNENYAIVSEWMNSEQLLEWIPAQGGVVCLPRIRPDVPVKTDTFYRLLMDEFATYVGPGHWFELSDTYFRLGYGWEPKEKQMSGLRNISAALRASVE